MDTMQQGMSVELERHVMAAPQKVWAVISTEEGMKRWLGPQNFEARLGGRVLFDVTHDGTRWLMFGEVLELVEDRQLSFSWQEFDTGTLQAWPQPTTVSVSLHEQAGGCLVKLRHSGFEKLPNAAEELQGYQTGWTSRDVLAGLATLVEQP